MDAEIRNRLIELHQLLSPHNRHGDLQAFLDAFKVFRGFAKASLNSTSQVNAISAVRRLKTTLPHATIADVLNREHQEKKMDALVEQLQRSPGQTKLPDFLEFLRLMATSSTVAIGDGLWNSDGDVRGSQVASPESGFATTPSEGPINEPSMFPGSHALPRIRPSTFPLPSSILLRSPPAFETPPGYATVSESQLLRDLLCVVLGFDGTLVKLTGDGCRLTSANLHMDDEMRQIALKIGYTGWLSVKLKKFCETRQSDTHIGLSGQRMCHVVMEELQRFRKNVAILDAKVHRDDPDRVFQGKTNPSSHLSPRKFLHAIQPDQHRLSILLNIVTSTNTLKGGELVTALNHYSQHGDPIAQLLASKLTYVTVEPLLVKLRRWIFTGFLDDPFNEFFVMENLAALPEAYWSDHYQLRETMIPYFLTPDVGRQLFSGGKSLAFVKAPKDSDGRSHQQRPVSDTRIAGMEAFTAVADCSFTGPDPIWDMERNRVKPGCLNQLIQASEIAAQAVVNVLRDEYHLGSHVYALQKFFLLGQGDFILCLLDSLSEYLDQPAISLHMRNISSVLELCVNSTDAKWEHPDVIHALDIMIQEVDEKEIGWDAFQLEYRLKKKNAVLSIVLTSSVLARYKRIFVFLWRIKRVEYLLCRIWMEDMCTRLENWKIPGFDILCHEAWFLLFRMLQFVQKLQYNFNVQVLEIAWTSFQEKLAGARSVDEILTFHNDYLALVEEKCFLQSKSVKNWQELGIQLRTVLNQIVKFDACFTDIQEAAHDELTNLANQPPDLEGDFYLRRLPSLVTRIQTLETRFKGEVYRFTSSLEKSDCDDSSCDLRSGLDFNNHYLLSGKKVKNLEALNVAGFDDSGPNSF